MINKRFYTYTYASILGVVVLIMLSGCNTRLGTPLGGKVPMFGAEESWHDEAFPGPMFASVSVASSAVTPYLANDLEKMLKKWGSPVPPEAELQDLASAVRGQLGVIQSGWKTGYTKALDRGVKYRPMMRQHLKRLKVPQELAYLPLMESGYKFSANSPAKARGLWQFMPATGRAYGLYGKGWKDDRLDPVAATQAGARHLKDLIKAYKGDVMLALAAYNAGQPRVGKAIRAAGGVRRFPAIAKHLARETRHYVPRFFAVVMVAADPARYGITPPRESDIGIYQLHSAARLDLLAKNGGVGISILRDLNDDIGTHRTTPPIPNYLLRVPQRAVAGLSQRLDLVQWRDGRAKRASSTITRALPVTPLPSATRISALPVSKSLRVTRDKVSTKTLVNYDAIFHTVNANDTLGSIGRWFGVGVKALRKANPRDTRGRYLRVGSKLLIPVSEPWHRREYTVRKGESLGRLARRFEVSVKAIRSWNGGRSEIQSGENLIIYHRAASAGVESVRYRVKAGNTLSGIAHLFEVSMADLRRWNGIRGRGLIAGRILNIYPRQAVSLARYNIRKGDQLGKIAARIGVSKSHLIEVNGLTHSDRIRPGQVLKYYRPKKAAISV